MNLRYLILLLISISCFQCISPPDIEYNFSSEEDRIWIGPDFWANRLQDWRISNGKVHCTTSSSNRNLFLLTSSLKNDDPFKMKLTCGFSDSDFNGSIGLRLGIKGEFEDYRDDAVRGKGIDITITTSGNLKIQSQRDTTLYELSNITIGSDSLLISLAYSSNNLNIEITDFTNGISESISFDHPIEWHGLQGGLALVSDFQSTERYNTISSAWFSKWSISGVGIETIENRTFGPILFSQYTLSRETLKMNVQMVPDNGLNSVNMEIKKEKTWIKKATGQIDPISRTALLILNDWKSFEDTPYRLVYEYIDYSGENKTQYFEGIIRKEPVKEELTIAAFTGNNDLGFPNQDLVENVEKQNPDFLFFSGDQIYEGVGGYGVQRAPENMAILDYLRKWYLFGWTYQHLLRSIPSVSLPDDHDVFHGNIWGESGKATPKHLSGTTAQDQGGYKMTPQFVNTVQRTQTAHLPDPYDPTPVEQNIGVYYTSLLYGGVSFGIIEDRKFKTAPTPLLPEAEVWNGWPQNKNYDITKADHPDAQLIGERQHAFLKDWVHDWSNGTWMKVLLSQTIFANVATLPEEEVHDQNVPKLRILEADEYAPNDRLVTDMDSNGWPQSKRDNVIRTIRKGFVLHIAGDQHLGSTIQYGVDEFRDAGYAICVPSVSNVWPRRWYPPFEGENPLPGNQPYTGDYEDGFGNKMTVLAVSNPVFTGRKPSNLYDRATGYGIIRINRISRDIILENWPRDIDPTKPSSKPYKGWPITINQMDNYRPDIFEFLPEVKVIGLENPVIQVINENSSEIIYTIRLNKTTFQPPVYESGNYTIVIGDPDIELKFFRHLIPGNQESITVNF